MWENFQNSSFKINTDQVSCSIWGKDEVGIHGVQENVVKSPRNRQQSVIQSLFYKVD